MKSLTLTLVIACAAIVACRDDVPTALPSEQQALAPLGTSGRSSTSRPDEVVFEKLAIETPGFAGFYLDSTGQLTVRAVRSSAAAARIAISRHVQAQELGLPRSVRGGVTHKVAQYTFAELASWRDVVFENLLGEDGVISDDVDEVNNRVTIGIDRRDFAGARVRLLARLKALRVPEAAVLVQPVAPISANTAALAKVAARTNAVWLRGTMDTLGGGYQIIGGGTCSAGFIADYGSVRVMATASHCTTQLFQSDGSAVSGYIGFGSLAVLGSESADPAARLCFPAYPCRSSDAALYALNGAIPSLRGGIAKLTERTSGQHGALTINPSDPWLLITSTEYGQPVGAVVEKVGRTTGWTYGTIQASCVDIVLTRSDASTYKVKCATRANYWGGGGDSGAPVFMLEDPSDPANSAVKLMGIHFGGTSDVPYDGGLIGNTKYYAGYRSFESDLGVGDQGVLNPKTQLSVPTPIVSYSLDEATGNVALSWPAVTVPWSTAPTSYRIYAWTTRVEKPDWDTPYEVTVYGPTVIASTSELSIIAGNHSTMGSCDINDYSDDTMLSHYYVVAVNRLNSVISQPDLRCFR